MIRIFCDSCKKELTDKDRWIGGMSIPLPRDSRVEVTLIADDYSDDLSERRSYCKYCVIDAINTLDDRPRPV